MIINFFNTFYFLFYINMHDNKVTKTNKLEKTNIYKKYKKKITKLDNKTKIITGVVGAGIIGAGIGIPLYLRKISSFTEDELQNKSIKQLKNINDKLIYLYKKCYSDISKEEKKQRAKYKINIFDKKLNDKYNFSNMLVKKGGSIFKTEKDNLIKEILDIQQDLKTCYELLKTTPKRIQEERDNSFNKIKNIEKQHINKLLNIKRFYEN